MISKNKHGGAREGSGRKQEAPTKQIRVDAELALDFKTLSAIYRSESERRRKKIIKTIKDLAGTLKSNENA